MSRGVAEWRVLNALLRRSPVSPEPVARDLGLTVRTVRRRYQGMLRDHLVWFQPHLDLRRADVVLANVIVGYDATRTAAAIARAVRAELPGILQFGHGRESAAGEDLRLWQGLQRFRNLAKVDAALARVAQLTGVTEVDASFPVRIAVVHGWLRDQVAAERARAAGPGRAGPPRPRKAPERAGPPITPNTRRRATTSVETDPPSEPTAAPVLVAFRCVHCGAPQRADLTVLARAGGTTCTVCHRRLGRGQVSEGIARARAPAGADADAPRVSRLWP